MSFLRQTWHSSVSNALIAENPIVSTNSNPLTIYLNAYLTKIQSSMVPSGTNSILMRLCWESANFA